MNTIIEEFKSNNKNYVVLDAFIDAIIDYIVYYLEELKTKK